VQGARALVQAIEERRGVGQRAGEHLPFRVGEPGHALPVGGERDEVGVQPQSRLPRQRDTDHALGDGDHQVGPQVQRAGAPPVHRDARPHAAAEVVAGGRDLLHRHAERPGDRRQPPAGDRGQMGTDDRAQDGRGVGERVELQLEAVDEVHRAEARCRDAPDRRDDPVHALDRDAEVGGETVRCPVEEPTVVEVGDDGVQQ
jgi:hypothetical protein